MERAEREDEDRRSRSEPRATLMIAAVVGGVTGDEMLASSWRLDLWAASSTAVSAAGGLAVPVRALVLVLVPALVPAPTLALALVPVVLALGLARPPSTRFSG